MKCICTTPNVVAKEGDEEAPGSATSVGDCEVDSLTYRDDLTNVDSVHAQFFQICVYFKENYLCKF